MTNTIINNNIEKYRRVQYLNDLRQPAKVAKKVAPVLPIEKTEEEDLTVLETYVEDNNRVADADKNFNERHIQSEYVNTQKERDTEPSSTWNA